jgi:hypothetical protein
MRKILAVGAIVALAWFLWPDSGIRHPPGVLVAGDPVQTAADQRDPWQKNGYTITALAEFELKARVLSRKRYWLDRESELAPVDLLLGWKKMSDQKVLDQLSLGQGSRWYSWSADRLPISESEIEAHCANMHIIPADAEVEKTLKSVRAGQIVTMKGFLICAQAPDGWSWRSSLSRTDKAGGSCELVWAEQLSVDE